MSKENRHDENGVLTNLSVWDWVVTHDGETVQITHDDMHDLKAEDIKRYATDKEVEKANPSKNFVKEIRDKKNWTQSELASMIGVSQPTINRIEKGKQELSKTIELAIRFIILTE